MAPLGLGPTGIREIFRSADSIGAGQGGTFRCHWETTLIFLISQKRDRVIRDFVQIQTVNRIWIVVENGLESG